MERKSHPKRKTLREHCICVQARPKLRAKTRHRFGCIAQWYYRPCSRQNREQDKLMMRASFRVIRITKKKTLRKQFLSSGALFFLSFRSSFMLIMLSLLLIATILSVELNTVTLRLVVALCTAGTASSYWHKTRALCSRKEWPNYRPFVGKATEDKNISMHLLRTAVPITILCIKYA